MSSFCMLFIASRIKPSLLMNSVYIKSAPFALHTARNGGSLTSSMGANRSGKLGSDILSIFIKRFYNLYRAYLADYRKANKITIGEERIMQTYLKTKPIWIQLLLFIGMAFGLFMILTLVGTVILSRVTGVSILQIKDLNKWNANDPKMIYFIRGLLLLQFLGLFLIPSLLFAYFSDPKPFQYLGLQRSPKNIYWLLAI